MNYRQLFEICKLTESTRQLKMLDHVCRIAITNRSQYFAVQTLTNIPWPVIAMIHFRESSQDFTRHLHNGDPLSARTVHVPKGRPVKGDAPFTWIDSAVDALSDRPKPRIWNIPSVLEFLERYNGLGYQMRNVNSPYIWNFTDLYAKGLFVGDGVYDPEKVEMRPGCAAMILMMLQKGVSFDFSAIQSSSSPLH